MLQKYLTREVKIGFLAIVCIALLFFGLNFLKGVNILEGSNYYYAKYDNLDGLVETSPVFIQGYQVGQVRAIKFDYRKEPAYMITLDIIDDVKLPEGTKAVLCDNGLISGKAVRLDIPAIIKGDNIRPGAELISIVENGMIKKVEADIMPKLASILSRVDSITAALNKITREGKIDQSLNSVAETTSNLQDLSQSLKNSISTDLPPIMKGLKSGVNDFTQITAKLKRIDMEKTFTKIDTTMSSLAIFTHKLNSPNGSLGLFLNDKSLYTNLSNTSRSADSLLIDLKNHPKRYVHFSLFGSKQK